jgi:hypothetical protein
MMAKKHEVRSDRELELGLVVDGNLKTAFVRCNSHTITFSLLK